MNFDNPRLLDGLCYDLVLSDYPRGLNRARIQNLANGAPPYSETEVEENQISVNISDLTHTRLCHDARTQFYNGFLKTGFFARAKLDSGPKHKREGWSAIVTKEWNRRLKKSIPYYEALKAKFGLLVLHGISPSVWENEEKWCTKPIGVEDLLIPGETLLGFDNLPFFVVRRTFTGIELMKLTAPEKRDPGWNMPFIERILAWMETQATQLRSLNWPDVWSPEKITERTKEEAGGTLAGDRAPRIDVFDIYAYDDSGDEKGWVRRMILDSWSEPALPNPSTADFSRKEGVEGDTNNFLFTSGNRKVGRSWQNIISLNFADLSATFPARYHSVRSLGWMTYASCHMGNRLRCKFYESVLEALMMLYEVNDQNDAQNALKLNLINKGFIDRSIRPVKAQDRWQVNANLVELGLRDNQQVIQQQSSSWVQNQNYSQDRTEKTRFQVMAELQATTSLAGVAFNQAYQYQSFEFDEIFRRFCNKDSRDRDVQVYRARCLKQGVPETFLNEAERWEIESERVLGAGNKTLEMTVAQQLMEWKPMFDPEPQRDIMRKAILAISDDPALVDNLVPEEPVEITASVREAEHIAATLMAGVTVEPMAGENHMEIIETLLKILATRVQAANESGGMMEAKELGGCAEIAAHIEERIGMLEEDKQQAERVRSYNQALGEIQNQLKAFTQRLQAAMEKQAKQGAVQGQGTDGKDIAKIRAIVMNAQTEDRIRTKSAAQRTAQRQVQFEQKLKQEQERHAAELRMKAQQHELEIARQTRQHAADMAATDLDAIANVERKRFSSTEE